MRVRIGDVVDKIVGDEDRYNTSLEYYVGGEHISSSRIKVYDRGLLKSNKGKTLGYQFHYPFRKRDVLFMTKNPYLKKCGMVDFDGICSIATFVMRSKDEKVLLQEYLAIVMQTDSLWNYLEANKSGSVNYFITWKTLEKYEFELPDIDSQRRIADIVWQMERTRAGYEELLAVTDELVKSQFIEMFGDPVENPKRWLQEPLGKHAEIIAGKPFDSGGYTDEGTNICGGLIIMPDRIAWEDCKHWPTTEGLEDYLLEEDDIVLAMDRPWITEGFKIAKIKQEELPALLIQRTARIRGIDLDQNFLLYMIKHPQFEKHCNITATTVPHISMKDISGYHVFIPPMALQKQYADMVQQSDKSKLV